MKLTEAEADYDERYARVVDRCNRMTDSEMDRIDLMKRLRVKRVDEARKTEESRDFRAKS